MNRVVDTINRERAEAEVHRAESSQGIRAESADTLHSIYQPEPNEAEEHFILRMSRMDTSDVNVRVGPFKHAPLFAAQEPGRAPSTLHGHGENGENATYDDVVIDRNTRKKLAGLMITSRGRKQRKH